FAWCRLFTLRTTISTYSPYTTLFRSSIAIFGDTRYDASYAKFIENVDVLIHEATFAADNETLANKYHHSTTKQAALLASKASVGTLLLTHISSRYQKEDEVMLLEE